MFEENELIKFEILKTDKGKSKKVIIDRLGKFSKKPNIENKLKSFDSPFIDLHVESIQINEKEGIFTAAIEKNFLENIDDRYSVSKIIWEELVKAKKYDKNKRLTDMHWYQCPYNEKSWGDLDNIDLTFGYKFDNLINEEKTLKESYYNVKPRWSYDWPRKNGKLDVEAGYFIKSNGAKIEYYSKGVYNFKSDFNLKTFPFDKQKLRIYLYNNIHDLDQRRSLISSYTSKGAKKFIESNQITGWNINNVTLKYDFHKDISSDYKIYDGISYEIDMSRKSGYYVFKIIFPILLILMICWSAVWIDPKEIESRLTITIVCLLSLIAYNFVIDSDLPKLEYLTIMDFIILISYVYAAIPNFLSIYSFQLLKKNKVLVQKYEFYEKRYGLPSYLLIVFLIIIINATNAPENTNAMFTWAAMR